MYSGERTDLLKVMRRPCKSKRKKKHEIHTEGNKAGVRWEVQLWRVKEIPGITQY